MRYFVHFLILTLIILCLNKVYCQENKYVSKEEYAFYDSINKLKVNKEFTAVSLETAKKNYYDYIKITEVENTLIENEYLLGYKVDSIMTIINNDYGGLFSQISVVKYERIENRSAIVYKDSKYDDFINNGCGYWLALSYDNEKTWKNYYTGLTENCYYFLEPDSKIILWKDPKTLQIEAKIVRKISATDNSGNAKMETVQDNIAIQFDIDKIIKDSDNDGFTDIFERRMLLDPENPDTDKDGFKDSEDKNPRFKSVSSEKAIIYQTLIENFRPDKNGVMEINLSRPPVYKESNIDKLFGDSESIILFVTNDKDIQKINLQNRTLLIMSDKEYSEYKQKYPYHFIENDYSRMFKCDNEKDTYKIIVSYLTSHETYILQRTKKGWKIFLLNSWK